MLQQVIVALVVAGAAAYAAWVLMPAAWRRRLARRLGRPEPSGGCGGCDGCAPTPANEGAMREAVITVRRRRG